jgi:hypothetical protein
VGVVSHSMYRVVESTDWGRDRDLAASIPHLLARRHADNDIAVLPRVLSVSGVHPEPVRHEGQHVGLDADLLVERLPDAVAA